jgi:hypothetical protein
LQNQSHLDQFCKLDYGAVHCSAQIVVEQFCGFYTSQNAQIIFDDYSISLFACSDKYMHITLDVLCPEDKPGLLHDSWWK